MRYAPRVTIAIAIAVAVAITSASAPPAATAKPRVLVYEFRNDGADDDALRLIRDSLTTQLDESGELEVLSVEEMNRLLKLEGDKEENGCDTSADACRAEIARSLGVRYVVFGNIGKLGALTLINVNLVDTAKTTTLARKQIEVRNLEEIPRELRGAVAELLVPLRSGKPVPALTWIAGGVGGGAAALAIGGVIVAVIENGTVTSRDPAVAFQAKDDAKNARNIAYGVALAGGVVAVGGAVLAFVGLME